MPRNKGIGRKFKPKRDASAPNLRPKGKQKLETTDRAEEPCNVDSDDEEFPIAMMALVRLSMMRCVEVQSLLLLSKSLMPHLNASGKEEMEPFLASYGTTRCPMAPAILFAEY